MDLSKEINKTESKEDFIKFLIKLRNDRDKNESAWENQDITGYLEAIGSWVEDMDGYFTNKGIEEPKNINWKFIATLFYVGKIYE